MTDAEFYRVCSTCKKPIGLGAAYFRCSVSTCNRNRLALYFCSLACWDAHLPEAKHRDAWAEPATAPTRAQLQHEEREELEREERVKAREGALSAEADQRRRIIAQPTAALPKDVLVVVSKLKAYVKARSGMNTSDGVTDVLSERIRQLCDAAIEVAQSDGRKTVLDRDFK